MSNIIEPIRNKDSSIKTNVQVVREATALLKRMRDGVPGESDEVRQRNFEAYCRITNNEPQILEWAESVCKIKDDWEAQKVIERTLLPVLAAAKNKKVNKGV